MFPRRFDEHPKALGMNLPRPPHVATEVPIGDEIRQNRLLQEWRVTIRDRLRGKGVHQVWRDHEIP